MAMPLSDDRQERIRLAMGKLNLNKPAWADKVPEDVWLNKMFNAPPTRD